MTSTTDQRLPFRTKLLYGAGDTGSSMPYTTLDVYPLYFLVTVVKLHPAYATAREPALTGHAPTKER
ncbi:MAG: hypothetical protein JXA09_06005 [Anaerolineae bacterium]|nr:hypothetical protein [Anaerolineae bacterium]